MGIFENYSCPVCVFRLSRGFGASSFLGAEIQTVQICRSSLSVSTDSGKLAPEANLASADLSRGSAPQLAQSAPKSRSPAELPLSSNRLKSKHSNHRLEVPQLLLQDLTNATAYPGLASQSPCLCLSGPLAIPALTPDISQ